MNDIEPMTETTKGWVVVNANHPNSNRQFLVASTFATTRKRSIELFTEDSMKDWKYWYTQFNYRCVKAENTITITF